MRIETVAPDLEIAIGWKYESNSTIFHNGDEVLLVDSMASREDAEDLRDHLGDNRVRFVISTHYFSDHMAGLAFFPEAMVVAHHNFRHTFETELYRSEEEAGFFEEPSIVIQDRTMIRWGRHTLEVFPNAGHTMGTLNIDVPEADLLFVGDHVVGNLVYLAYSSPAMIREALRKLTRRGRTRLISSHGGLCSSSRLESAIEYLDRLEAIVRRAWKKGRDSILTVPMDECLPDEVVGTEFESVFHQRNLEVIFERRLFGGS